MYTQDDLQVRWLKLRIKLKEHFNIKPNIEGILILIGVQEIGKGVKAFSKEEKQDLMHVATCTVLALGGYYLKDGLDEEGWPHFTQVKELPAYNMFEQENFLKDHILMYFNEIDFLNA
jgi:hypothetical protein